jgi:RNA polymerase sigma-70 factor (ECF subfamily)
MDTLDTKQKKTGSDTIDVPDTVKEVYRDDYELVQRAIEGDADAASEIVEQHQKNVYNLGLRLGGNESEAECILQDTFLKVFEKLDLFKGNSRLGTWIHRIATNEALMRMRGRKGKYFVTIEEEIPDDKDEKGGIGYIAKSLDRDPLELTLDEELRQKLEEAIVSLPPNLRTAFVLKDLEGLSMAEIGERTEKTVSAIKADLHRARVKLRKKLAEFVEEKEHGKL